MDGTAGLRKILPSGWVTLIALAATLDVHQATVFRWAGKGVRGIRLPTTRIGGRTGVTPQDLRRFLDALNPQNGSPEPADAVRAPDQLDTEGGDRRV